MAEKFTFASNIPLMNLIDEHKSGKLAGITSICSTNRAVLQAAMWLYKKSDSLLLIESTCNQVNQDGGYTGMTPRQFASYIHALAREADFPVDKIILGGDHLGPNPWKKESAAKAMQKAEQLVHDYVAAGYNKIHLDASMPCGDDGLLSPEEIAERSVRLAVQSEKASQPYPLQNQPLYVIGTEVPAPGGLAAGHNQAIHITKIDDVEETIDLHGKMLIQCGLEDALRRIIAVVVSPGVEFDNREVFLYDRSKTRELRSFIEEKQGLVYEAHSTDYQPQCLLHQMIEDHFAILKVGPALTFAFREAILRLAAIEEEMPGIDLEERSDLVNIVLKVMRANPQNWQDHYSGSEEQIKYALKYSFSDRIRYYWGFPQIETALKKLIWNLKEHKIPMALVSQFFPSVYPTIIEQQVQPDPDNLIKSCVSRVLENYQVACGV